MRSLPLAAALLLAMPTLAHAAEAAKECCEKKMECCKKGDCCEKKQPEGQPTADQHAGHGDHNFCSRAGPVNLKYWL